MLFKKAVRNFNPFEANLQRIYQVDAANHVQHVHQAKDGICNPSMVTLAPGGHRFAAAHIPSCNKVGA